MTLLPLDLAKVSAQVESPTSFYSSLSFSVQERSRRTADRQGTDDWRLAAAMTRSLVLAETPRGLEVVQAFAFVWGETRPRIPRGAVWCWS